MLVKAMLCFACVIATFPVASFAQGVQFTVGAGVAQVDGSGVHTTSVVHLSAEHQLFKSWARLQGRVSVSRPDEDFIGKRTYLIPEVVLQAQIPNQLVQPYINVGAGAVRTSGNSVASYTRLSLSAGVGLRAAIHRELGGQVEARARGIGSSFGSSMTELTAGLSWQF